jgi:hypothetical protein
MINLPLFLEWFGTLSLLFSILALYAVLFRSLLGRVEIQDLKLFIFVMIAGVLLSQLLFWESGAFDPMRTNPVLKILWFGGIAFFIGSVLILFSLISRAITQNAPTTRSLITSIIFKFLVIAIGLWLTYVGGVFNPNNLPFRSSLFTWAGMAFFTASVIALGSILYDAISTKVTFITSILVYTVISGIILGIIMLKLSGAL